MHRVVLDTNVLVSSADDEWSASWRILEACTRGELTAIVSPALRREYEHILPQTVNSQAHREAIQRFVAAAEEVFPRSTPRIVPDDPEDDKIVAAAVAGRADAVITNDRHLLDLDPSGLIRILRPVTFEHLRRETGGEGWRDLAQMIGIGT